MHTCRRGVVICPSPPEEAMNLLVAADEREETATGGI
jgi:hypothetical protein